MASSIVFRADRGLIENKPALPGGCCATVVTLRGRVCPTPACDAVDEVWSQELFEEQGFVPVTLSYAWCCGGEGGEVQAEESEKTFNLARKPRAKGGCCTDLELVGSFQGGGCCRAKGFVPRGDVRCVRVKMIKWT